MAADDNRRMESPYPESAYGWNQYRREVISKLEALEEQNKDQNAAIAKLDKDMAVLSTRMMLTASALSLIVAAIVEGVVKMFGH